MSIAEDRRSATVDTPARLRRVAEVLDAQFIGRSEVIRLLLCALVAREHAVLIGPPGTAKSALLRMLANLLDVRYFEYLLTRFTEPNEIFGPVDIAAFRQGLYRRTTKGMLPDAQIVFLDEVFKSNSAILNSLLMLLHERRFIAGGAAVDCPLISVFGASNEIPADESLAALFDRFILRIRSPNLDSYHFSDLLEVGVRHEVRGLAGERVAPIVTAAELDAVGRELAARLTFSDEVLATYKGLIFQVRAEGISLSDRRAVKILKLVAASAYLDGRAAADAGDLFILKHVWNTEDQSSILEALVNPVLDAFYHEHPERRRLGAVGVGVEALAAEVDRIRQVLLGGPQPSDVQLFSQLKALGEVRAALAELTVPEARVVERRVVDLLNASLKTGRFSGP